MIYLDEMIKKYPALEFCRADIATAYEILKSSYENKRKLLVCGNGGSAADSEHIVGELMKGFMRKRQIPEEYRSKIMDVSKENGQYLCDNLQGGLPAISLVSHSALMTAFSNDVAPDMVFAQQVYSYAMDGDVLIGLSTSGNSLNVVYASQVAKSLGMKVIAFTGETGGKLKDLCDVTIKAPSKITPEIQEYHLPIYHTLCMMIEAAFF